MADKLPGNGWFGWLGRQVGYVKKAVDTRPATRPSRSVKAGPDAKANAAPAEPSAGQSTPTVLYREGRVEEAEHPTQPGVKLRRTVIDEVIVEKAAGSAKTPPDQGTR
jgi:hypothetical protein